MKQAVIGPRRDQKWGRPKLSEVEWARLKAHELRALAERNAVVMLPVAAIEQHGPHLPVMVDTRLAGEVSARAARTVADRCPAVVLPTIWHGLSEHHMPFGGTITLDFDTFHMVIRGVVESVLRNGFSRVLIVNGHGGNIAASEIIAQELTLEFEVPILAVTYWLETTAAFVQILEDQENVLHAGEGETSMMLALEPDLIDPGQLAGAKGADGLGFNRAGKSGARWRSLAHVTENGVIGDPTTASAEKGERMLDAAAAALANLIADDASWAPEKDLRPDAIGGVRFQRD